MPPEAAPGHETGAGTPMSRLEPWSLTSDPPWRGTCDDLLARRRPGDVTDTSRCNAKDSPAS